MRNKKTYEPKKSSQEIHYQCSTYTYCLQLVLLFTGVRVPFLKVGWNRQFLMMKEFGFVYDSSMVAPFSNPPLWPYTLDYKMPHECQGANQHCPSRSYPGLWEMVMNQLNADSYSCTMVGNCPTQLSGEEIYHMLHHNLQRHYNTNRAPLGLFFHSSWFKKPEYMIAFKVSFNCLIFSLLQFYKSVIFFKNFNHIYIIIY